MRTNCTDIDDTTTTPITTTEELSCGNSDEIICDLQGQIKELKDEVTEIKSINNEMIGKLAELSQENAQIKRKLDEVLEGILELTTRPCGI